MAVDASLIGRSSGYFGSIAHMLVGQVEHLEGHLERRRALPVVQASHVVDVLDSSEPGVVLALVVCARLVHARLEEVELEHGDEVVAEKLFVVLGRLVLLRAPIAALAQVEVLRVLGQLVAVVARRSLGQVIASLVVVHASLGANRLVHLVLVRQIEIAVQQVAICERVLGAQVYLVRAARCVVVVAAAAVDVEEAAFFELLLVSKVDPLVLVLEEAAHVSAHRAVCVFVGRDRAFGRFGARRAEFGSIGESLLANKRSNRSDWRILVFLPSEHFVLAIGFLAIISLAGCSLSLCLSLVPGCCCCFFLLNYSIV